MSYFVLLYNNNLAGGIFLVITDYILYIKHINITDILLYHDIA